MKNTPRDLAVAPPPAAFSIVSLNRVIQPSASNAAPALSPACSRPSSTAHEDLSRSLVKVAQERWAMGDGPPDGFNLRSNR